MKIALKIAYDGTAFCGFQFQPDHVTIQSVLTEAAEKVFGMPVNVTGCSRTDAGVHAEGMVATIFPKDPSVDKDTWCSVPVNKIHRVFRFRLPPEIAVLGATIVPDDFHPRYDVVMKEYYYRIWDHPWHQPFLTNRVCEWDWHVNDDGLEKMKSAALLLQGKHDFSGFMAVGSKITDTVREVYDTRLFRDGDGCLVFSVKADGFLYNMVRIMVGTLLEVSANRKTIEDVHLALETGDRTHAGFTAPAAGLYLHEAYYKDSMLFIAE